MADLPEDHREIWLAPKCHDDRTWCKDNVWDRCDDDCEEKPVKYIRADLAVSLDEIVGVLEKADYAFAELKAAFGAPGDHGYDSPEGKALFTSYKAWAEARSLLHRLKAQTEDNKEGV